MAPLDLFGSSKRSPGARVSFNKAAEAKDDQQHGTASSKSSFKRLLRKVISFKDLHITLHEGSSGSLSHLAHDSSTSSSALVSNSGSARVAVEKKKLVIIMVGLPGRGKTFLCNKLRCYLNWLGHGTAHFNVGQYRRHIKGAADLQDAAFFDHNNAAGRAAREHAFQLALDDMLHYLDSDAGQVAIFDATNSTQDRRNKLSSVLRTTGVRFIFIENICTDPDILRNNYLNKMRYSPDYKDVCMEQALSDFADRIKRYEEVYEPISDRSMHYIKLTDMVTGRGHLDINRISGYLPGKLVSFLMQVCKSGIMGNSRKIWLTRHGESMFNRAALIGGDSPLSENGQAYADVLPDIILSRLPKSADGTPVSAVSVWTSTLQRTIQTAAALPFAKLKWKALDEIDAGICDGLTYAQIAERYPAEYEARKKDKLRYRYPRGESYLDMIARLEPVISEMEREGESIVIVGHQAVLRVIFGYLMAQPQADIPLISIPLHTVIELTPRPDGTMGVEYIPVPVHVSDAALGASMGASIGSVPDAPPLGALPPVAPAARPGSASPDAAVVIGGAAGGGKGCFADAAAAGAAADGAVPSERLSSCSSGSTLVQIASLNAAGSSGSLQPQQQHWPSQLVAPSAS